MNLNAIIQLLIKLRSVKYIDSCSFEVLLPSVI